MGGRHLLVGHAANEGATVNQGVQWRLCTRHTPKDGEGVPLWRQDLVVHDQRVRQGTEHARVVAPGPRARTQFVGQEVGGGAWVGVRGER